MLKPREKGAAKATVEHYGFQPDGSIVKSSEPFDTPCTNFVRHLLRKVRGEKWSPAQVVRAISLESEPLTTMFTLHTIGNWAVYDRYHLWPMTQYGTSAEAVVRSHGRGTPLWITDPNAWEAEVRHAEKLRGEKPSTTYYWHAGQEIPLGPVDDKSTVAKRVLREMGLELFASTLYDID